ncbi:MAG: hypothetical protein JXQ76_05935 [Campylobacterales bacterium]|nr:hypothetical protein [Campylobacterales bacterium]
MNKNLILALIVLIGIATTAHGVEFKYLDEMMDDDTPNRNLTMSKSDINSYCNSLKKYGYTKADIRECIKEKIQYQKREKLRIEAQKSCFIKYAGNDKKLVNCYQRKNREIRRGRL